jgi:hypothetical protein
MDVPPDLSEVLWDIARPLLWIAGLVLAAVGAVAFVLVIHGGPLISENGWHAKAVDAGKAEYYLDEHHERQWRWKQ